MCFSLSFYSNRQKKISHNRFLSVVAMIAHLTHAFDELIGSPRTNHYLAIVANRFIQPLATSFAKLQPCEWPHRASRVRNHTKYWQTASQSCRFTLTTLLSQSDCLPTELPFFYTRIEEYIAPAFDQFKISHLNQSLGHYAGENMVQRIVQRAVSIGTYENLP